MTAPNLIAEQMLEKAIAWLLNDGKIGPKTAQQLRDLCLDLETDKEKALGLLPSGLDGYECLTLSAEQVGLIRSVVKRCPDSPPAPEKPPLAVGQLWRRRDGQRVMIERSECFDSSEHAIFRADGFWYNLDGTFSARNRSYIFWPQLDLVEYIGLCQHKEEAPDFP